jgi:hypothetical protein
MIILDDVTKARTRSFMKPGIRDITLHLAFVIVIATLLVFSMIYPFLPGRYDRLAVPLSTMAQVFGVVGLALVPGGLLWLTMPRFGFALSVLSTAVGTCVAAILGLFATLSVGNAFGVLTLTIWAYALVQLIPRLKRLKHADSRGFHPAPVYLVCLPVLALVSQLALVAPMTRASRARAIANATEFIGDIEQYHARHGRYPASLEAQYNDYYPDVVGVDQYTYAPQGDSYNLSFEQPRFLLDRFGTREWVVYNPRDEHRVYSHTAWLLPPPEVPEPSQGWYASGETGYAHWMYFFFD